MAIVKQSIEDMMKQMNKTLGDDTVVVQGNKKIEKIKATSTGSFGLDRAIGIGGIPEGRIIEIYGPQSVGKTSQALTCIKEAQKLGKVTAFIDAEHALDLGYARDIGVDTSSMLVVAPKTAEQGMNALMTMCENGQVGMIVVDSVSALTPKSEVEGDMDKQSVGVQAKLMSKLLRKITAIIAMNKTTVIFINQIRDKIGMTGYGPTTDTTGGKGLRFYASVRLDMRRIASVKKGEEIIANTIKVKVEKNKVGNPYKIVIFDILFGEGISRSGEILDYAVKNDIIAKGGAWFSYKGEKIGQGRDKARLYLEDNPKVLAEVEKLVVTKLDEIEDKKKKKK